MATKKEKPPKPSGSPAPAGRPSDAGNINVSQSRERVATALASGNMKGLTVGERSRVFSQQFKNAVSKGDEKAASLALTNAKLQAARQIFGKKILDDDPQRSIDYYIQGKGKVKNNTQKILLNRIKQNQRTYGETFAKPSRIDDSAGKGSVTDTNGNDTSNIKEKKITESASDAASAASSSIPSQTLTPGRDVINFQTTPTSPEAMQQILFEEIAGYELVNMARRDTIEGQSDVYTVISNLSSIRREYNPAQLISLQKPNFTGFETYQVDLNNYVPGDGYLQKRDLTNFYYIASNGDLVIELNNLQEDDEIEVQMANNGKIT